MKARRSPLTRLPGAALLALAGLSLACRPGDDLTAPAFMAKGGNGNPTVSSMVPDGSKRGVILDVTVNGSGFDQGSTVAFEREGVPAAGITTNSTSFVNPRKLVANITIGSTADTGKYDVAVTTSGGRNSLGLGLFTVEYELAELGIIGGIWSRAHAINDLQEVVGESCTGDCLSTAFYWSETGGLVDLGKLPGYSRSGAYGINNRGQVFGRVFCRPDDPGCGGESPSARVRWDRVGGSWTITPMQGCSVADPLDHSERFLINNNDQCVARGPDFTLLIQTVSGGAVLSQTTLPPLNPGWWSNANAISDAPMIAGTAAEVVERIGEASARLGPPEPVIWYRHASGGWRVLALGIPSGDFVAYATDVAGPDASGRVWVTGYTETSSGGNWRLASLRGVRWTLRTDGLGGWQVVATEFVAGGSSKGALLKVWPGAVNRDGEVVGIVGDYIMTGAPFKWPIGSGLEVLPLPAGGAQGRAVDINNQGWIAGAVWDEANQCDRAAIWRLIEP